MKKLSKFDFGSFTGGYDDFAISKQRYSEKEAIEIYIKENLCNDDEIQIGVCDSFVTHRFGVDEEGEKYLCWWLEYNERKRSCPTFAIHKVRKNEKRQYGYRYYQISNGNAVEIEIMEVE